jgi:putative (di)nucleoside polyphosphate hydrolase
MLSRYMQLPYRPCVGIMLLNRSGHVCVGQRLPECSKVAPPECWQMPQGSIAPAEPTREAGLRILAEDMGVIRARVLAEAPGWFTYELPAHLIGIALKGQYCGQRQKWLAARFLGDDEEIGLGPRNGAAVWRWVPAADVPQLAPRLKRELYQDVIATFAPLLPEHGRPAPTHPRTPTAPQPAVAELPWFVSLIG